MTISERSSVPAVAPQQPAAPEEHFARDVLLAARYYLGGRRALFILLAAGAAAGLALNWGWLVAAGLAPVLIGILPCAVMCGLGLCMSRLMGRSCGVSAKDTDGIEPAETVSALPETIETAASPVEDEISLSNRQPQTQGDDDA